MRWRQAEEAMRAANLALRFLLELVMLAGLAWSG